MRRTFALLAGGAAAMTLAAAPVVREGSVKIERDGNSSRWLISYVLDGDPAVVTLDVLTNGVSIGASNFASAEGFGRVVQPGAHEHVWRARQSWPDHVVDALSVKVTAWALNCPPPYLVLSLDSATPPVYYADTNSIPQWGANSNRLYKTGKMVLRRIPSAGLRWRMGSGLDEPGADSVREVPHYVTLTKDYYMAIYPTTQAQYRLATGGPGNAAFSAYPDFDWQPVGGMPYNYVRGASPAVDWPATGTNVADRSAVDFFRRATGCDSLDLPTDAEWEFACRGGVEGYQLYTGRDLSNTVAAPELDPIAWYSGNSNTDGAKRPHEVGLKQPNAYGLYDMLGNVMEMCLDWDNGALANSDGSPAVDPPGPDSYNQAMRRVFRGGVYNQGASTCRAAARMRGLASEGWTADYGFRLKCAASAK
ncbi:MAG: formylglycine-generating enzyme family protein [Kiritimatiellae bacterium]|nr:formylglycine-generating enzyme family protein [Kiritimatiellia bacterium]